MASTDNIPAPILKLLVDVAEYNIELDTKAWETLKKTLIQEVPHQLIRGDRFELEMVEKEPTYQVYLKWEENSHFIRGMILPLKQYDLNMLTHYTYRGYQKICNFLSQNQIDIDPEEESFLFEMDFLYDLCRFFAAENIDVFFKKNKILIQIDTSLQNQ